MKQKDIALILIVVFISTVISFVVSSSLFSTPKANQAQVEQASVISPNFSPPNDTYFNSNSVDPTQLITIGNSTNPLPFNGGN